MIGRLAQDVREMVREQVDFRDLLYQMTKRDLLLRYKQTVMGFGWAVAMPLLNTVIFSIIFMRVAPIDPGVPYPVFAFCGLWAWNLFASSLKFAVNSLSSNAHLVTKVYFPREIFPTSAIIVSLVDFAVAGVMLAGFMIYYQIPVGWPIACLPLIVATQVMFTTALGLLLSMWNLFYRDVKYLFEIVIVVWMFASSVVYPVDLVGGRLEIVMRLNPMTPILESYRAVLLFGRWPDWNTLGAVTTVSAALLLWAWIAFHRSEFEFAENV